MTKRNAPDFTLPQCQPFHLEGGDHAVLLIHGFTGSAAHMRLLGEKLHQQGFTVRGINLPGHATTMEDMVHTRWHQWLQASKEALMDLKDRYGHVSVAGLSMGGVLTLLLAEQMEVTAAVTISAPTSVQAKLMPLARFAAPFVKQIWWDAKPERMNKINLDYDCGYPGFYTRSAADLNKLMGMARRNLHAITCPILAVQSREDAVISSDSAEVIMAGVSSDRKGILWLEDVPHVCTISREVDNIALAAGELLKSAE